MRVLLVKLCHPLTEVSQSTIESSLAFNSSAIGRKVVIAMASTLDDVDRNFVCALQSATRAAFPRYGSGSPGVKLTVDPDQAGGVDVTPTARVLVYGMVSTASLKTILEAVLVREAWDAIGLDIVLPGPKSGQETRSIESTPRLPPLKTTSS